MKLFGKYAKKVQTKLKRLGFYNGEIDGIFGRKSKAALIAFQRYASITVSGIYGAETERALFGDIIEAPYLKEVMQKYPQDTTSTLIDFYGDPANEVGHRLVKIILPYKMKLAWGNYDIVEHIAIHEKCADSFTEAFENILKEYGKKEIENLGLDWYGGAYNKRKITGGKRWSVHAYGAAIDLYPQRNGYRTKAPAAIFSNNEYKPFIEIMERAGFYSLGHARGFDWMHFQCAWRK